MAKVNIGIAGGSCTGKSTLAAALFARLKEDGLDYDLVTEESRKLRGEFGNCRSPFERFYMWLQQEREELRSNASDGFVTDTVLYGLYIRARQYAQEPRDKLAIRELFRMCLDLEEANRYQLIIMAEDPAEFPFKTDQSRSGSAEKRLTHHRLLKSFIEHHCSQKLLLVRGGISERVDVIMKRLLEMRRVPT